MANYDSKANYDRAVLTDAERSAGVVLACRAKPLSDVHLSWLGGAVSVELPTVRMPAQVTNIEQVSPTVKRLYGWPEETLQFGAGQFARLRFGEPPARAYSMANAPGDEALEFHMRLIPGGMVSGHIASHLKIGDSIEVEGPFSNAHLRPEDNSHLVLVAGSSGLAPAKSIIRTALRSQPDRAVHLYFGVRDEAHVYDENELKSLAAQHKNLTVETVLSEPEGGTSRRVGMLSEILAEDLRRHSAAQFYMAGPPEMVDAVAKVVADFGISKDQIHADPFHTAGKAQDVEAEPRGVGKLLTGFGKLFPMGRLRQTAKRPVEENEKSMKEAAE